MLKDMFGAAGFLCGLAAFSTAGLAADQAAYDWTGFFAGIQAGYGLGTDQINDNNVVGGLTDYRDNFPIDGFTGGVHAGVNRQFKMLVLGIEGDAEYSNVNGANPKWPFGDATRSDSKSGIDAQGSLRLRAGVTFDRALIYATGGLALGDVNASFYDSATADHFSSVEAGWTVGGGLEYAINDAWSVRAEYRYTDFEPLTGETANTDPGWLENDDLRVHAVRIGASYHF